MHPYEYRFSFRITHPDKDLSEAFAVLSSIEGFIPGRIWKAGENRKTPQGKELEGNYPNSYCFFNFFENTIQSSLSTTLSESIDDILEKLHSQKDILKDIVASGGELNFFIAWYVDANCGDIFTSAQLKRLADIKIGLMFDIYPTDQSNNESSLKTE